MKKKQLLVMVAMMLVVAMVSVAGTMAYLIANSGPVTNTFSVGKLDITLDEAKVNQYGELVNDEGKTEAELEKDADFVPADRVTANGYKLVPGHEYIKDPTVHFAAESEPAYLFVKVVNEITAIEAATTIADQIEANGWTPLSGNAENGIYWKEVPANTGTAAVDYKVFEEFTLLDDIQKETLNDYAGETVTVTAYAIQKDGFTTAAAAWDAAPSTWKN